jgi:hypothetical protein
MVVQSCLRGWVTFVTSALLSYRNRLLVALTETGHMGYGRHCYVFISNLGGVSVMKLFMVRALLGVLEWTMTESQHRRCVVIPAQANGLGFSNREFVRAVG